MAFSRKSRGRRTFRRRDDGATLGGLAAFALGALGLAWLFGKSFDEAAQLEPRYIGIPTEIFDFVAASQERDMWCWAASIQMILNFYGVPVNQEQIVSRTYGLPLNEPGTDQAISASLNGWGINANGRHFTVQSSVAAGPPSPAILFRELSHGRPILLTFNPGALIGHAVVITSASRIRTVVTSLVYRDPAPTLENRANKGRVELFKNDLAQFLPYVRSHWLVSVRHW